MPELKPTSASSWPSLRKLSWVGLFVAAGALATVVVLGPWRGLDAGASHDTSAPSPSAGSPAIERRSLLAETARPATGSESASAAAVGELSPSEVAAPAVASPARPSAATAVAAGDVRSDAKGGAARNPNPSRVTRAVPLVLKRRRATRSEFVQDSPAGESELDGLFNGPAPLERRTAGETTGARELDGLFPSEEQAALGANGAPLPD